jgi:hypothetical protein
VLWYGAFFGYGLHDDDALAPGGLFLAICGGLSWHGMVYLVVIWIDKTFYLLLSFVIQAQG